MPSIAKFATVAALALVAVSGSADASTCTQTVVNTYLSASGPTVTCLVNVLSSAPTPAGVTPLNLTQYPPSNLFANPNQILSLPYGVGITTGIFTALLGGFLNTTGQLPACQSPSTPYYTLIADGASACGTAWSTAVSSSPLASLPADSAGYPTDLLHAIATISQALFVLGLAYNIFEAAVPCIPSACASVASGLCAGAYGPNTNSLGIPISDPSAVQTSSFAQLSANVIYWANNNTAILTHYLSNPYYGSKGLLGNAPKSVGGPFTGTNVTLNCAIAFGGKYGSLLGGGSAAPSWGAGVAGLASAFAAMASM